MSKPCRGKAKRGRETNAEPGSSPIISNTQTVELATRQNMRFLDLPTEIRFQIYEDLFFDKEYLLNILKSHRDIICHYGCTTFCKPYKLAILRTCSTIHQEAAYYFYSNLTVEATDEPFCQKADTPSRAYPYSVEDDPDEWNYPDIPLNPCSLIATRPLLLQIGARNFSYLRSLTIDIASVSTVKFRPTPLFREEFEHEDLNVGHLLKFLDIFHQGHNLARLELRFLGDGVFQCILESPTILEKLRGLRPIERVTISIRKSYSLDKEARELQDYLKSKPPPPSALKNSPSKPIDSQAPTLVQRAQRQANQLTSLLDKRQDLINTLNWNEARVNRIKAQLDTLTGSMKEAEEDLARLDMKLDETTHGQNFN